MLESYFCQGIIIQGLYRHLYYVLVTSVRQLKGKAFGEVAMLSVPYHQCIATI